MNMRDIKKLSIVVLLVILLLANITCSSTRIVICPGKPDRMCIESQLPRDSKIIAIKPTHEKGVYEVEYRE